MARRGSKTRGVKGRKGTIDSAMTSRIAGGKRGKRSRGKARSY